MSVDRVGDPAPAAGPPALAAAGLVAGYRRGRRRTVVVEAARLAAHAGRVTAVVGPNGGGKSTLLRTLVGAQPALGGSVAVAGTPLARLSRTERARLLAVVLTDRVEAGLLTVGEVVELGRHPHTGWRGALTEADAAVARRAGRDAGVERLWDRPFAELSDGQRQRALVARALAQEPSVLVLDEPTAFLDVAGRVALSVTLAGLARAAGLAVVVSTHDLDLALAHADAVWLVHGGTVRAAPAGELVRDGTLARAFAPPDVDDARGAGSGAAARAELDRILGRHLAAGEG